MLLTCSKTINSIVSRVRSIRVDYVHGKRKVDSRKTLVNLIKNNLIHFNVTSDIAFHIVK